MKKLSLLVFVASLFILGCSSGSSKKEEAKKLLEETELIDSAAKVLEQTKDKIESTVQELDSALNEL